MRNAKGRGGAWMMQSITCKWIRCGLPKGTVRYQMDLTRSNISPNVLWDDSIFAHTVPSSLLCHSLLTLREAIKDRLGYVFIDLLLITLDSPYPSWLILTQSVLSWTICLECGRLPLLIALDSSIWRLATCGDLRITMTLQTQTQPDPQLQFHHRTQSLLRPWHRMDGLAMLQARRPMYLRIQGRSPRLRCRPTVKPSIKWTPMKRKTHISKMEGSCL